jgi:flavodoxin
MKALVIYYTRSGTTKSAAEAIAKELKAAGHEVVVEEIIDKKNRKGVIGWLKAGRDAMKKYDTEIEPIKADAGAFDIVVAGTPIWAWTATPAIRAFLTAHGAKMKKAAFFCTMGGSGDKGTFEQMEKVCGKKPTATLALMTKQVKKNEASDFGAKVKELVKQLTA